LIRVVAQVDHKDIQVVLQIYKYQDRADGEEYCIGHQMASNQIKEWLINQIVASVEEEISILGSSSITKGSRGLCCCWII